MLGLELTDDEMARVMEMREVVRRRTHQPSGWPVRSRDGAGVSPAGRAIRA